MYRQDGGFVGANATVHLQNKDIDGRRKRSSKGNRESNVDSMIEYNMKVGGEVEQMERT